MKDKDEKKESSKDEKKSGKNKPVEVETYAKNPDKKKDPDKDKKP